MLEISDSISVREIPDLIFLKFVEFSAYILLNVLGILVKKLS